MWVRSLDWEDLLEKGMANHFTILAWRIPWTEETGGLQCMGSQRVRHDWSDWIHTGKYTVNSHHWYGHLAPVFVPSLRLEDAIAHTEACTKFTQQALNSDQAISLLNSEVTLTIKVVLQDDTALNILLASQGGTCTVIQTECCVFISDESSNIKHLMTHMKNQIFCLKWSTF